MPYGYNPADYRKDYGFVAGAAQTVASGIIGYSEAQKEQQRYQDELNKELAKAEKLASENKNLINISYKTIKTRASKEIDDLVKRGSIDEKTGRDMLKTLVKPEKFTSFKDYATVNGDAFDSLMAKINKIKQESLGEEVVESQKPQPQFSQPEMGATSEEVSGIKKYEVTKPGAVIGQTPGAETQHEIAQAPGVASQAPTTEQLEAIPAYKSAPSEQQLTKAKLEEEKLRISKVKLGLQESKESNINWYREQMVKLRGMAQELNEAKDDLSREKARADLVDSEVAIRSLIADGEKELKDLKGKTDEFGEPIPEDTIETAKKQKDIEDLKRLLHVIPDLQMQTIKRGTHVDMKTGKVSPAGQPTTSPAAIPAPKPGQPKVPPTIGSTKQPMNKMEQAIRDTLTRKGVDAKTIEEYIQEKKRKGQL